MDGRITLFCIGFGYTATVLAKLLFQQSLDVQIIGTSRNPAALDLPPSMLGNLHLVNFTGEATAEFQEAALQATHILLSAGPGPKGDPVFSALMEALSGDQTVNDRVEWVGYLSTTGVYGDRSGGWAFESDALTPTGERGEARVRAEAEWASSGLPMHFFRLPGIYGPFRNPLSRARHGQGQAVLKPGQVFSRIHVDDLAAGLWASMQRPNPGRSYNLADDQPAPPHLVTLFAAETLGLPKPDLIAFEEANLTPMARSFYAESKRVSNARAKSELGWRPLYANYRVGLEALFQAKAF